MKKFRLGLLLFCFFFSFSAAKARGKWEKESWYVVKRNGKVVGYMSLYERGVGEEKVVFSKAVIVGGKNDRVEIKVFRSKRDDLIHEIQISQRDGRRRMFVEIRIDWSGKKGKKVGKTTAVVKVKGKEKRFALPWRFTSKTFVSPFHLSRMLYFSRQSKAELFFYKGILIKGTVEKKKTKQGYFIEFRGKVGSKTFVEQYTLDKKGKVTSYRAPNGSLFLLHPKDKVLKMYKKAFGKAG